MRTDSRRQIAACIVAVVATFSTSDHAQAQAPAVSVRIERVGAGSSVVDPVGTPCEDRFCYSANVNDWGFQSTFELTSSVNAASRLNAFGGFFTLKNLSLLPEEFIFEASVSNAPSPLLWVASGSVAGVLIGGSAGGPLTSVQASPVYRAIIRQPTEATTIASLLQGNPYSVIALPSAAAAIVRESFGEPIQPPFPIGSLGESRGIRLQFLLCGGCEVSFSTSFIVKPLGGDPPPPQDSDADGFSDLQDNCPTVYNPTQADCDNDGIGDACDVPASDYNANGIPDYCECIADLFVDGVVNGVDLGVLLAYWGPTTSAAASQRSDMNRDGAVDGIDLGYLLSRWGPCTN